MQFDSLTFVIFFAVVVLGYASTHSWSWRKNWLLLASYIFYAAWNPLFLPLLVGTTTLDWWMAQRMDASRTLRGRRYWLWAILLINLGFLGYFKYSHFVLRNTNTVLAMMGFEPTSASLDLILPIGISFYTFHSLSYCIDIYRRRFAVVRNWRDYALYVSFFPQLVAGPIVRWSEMQSQIERPRKMSMAWIGLGCCLMVVGLFEKIVLADNLFAPVADSFYNNPGHGDGLQAWVATLAFSGQIFSDFAGYTTCALGAALVLGFRLPVNFRAPYAAEGFSDFWRRWHISLSTWLRDYLYVSLGGNRVGRWLTYRNLMLTMLLGGLWHGAAWTFVIWGGLHGLYLVIERWLRGPNAQPLSGLWPRVGYRLLTFALVVLAWVWFRSAGYAQGWQVTTMMLDMTAISNWHWSLSGGQGLALGGVLLLLAVQWRWRERELGALLMGLPGWLLGGVMAFMLACIALSSGDGNAFIYFQF